MSGSLSHIFVLTRISRISENHTHVQLKEHPNQYLWTPQINKHWIVYLEFKHGAQLFLSDLQRADLSGQSHERGVETLVLLLRETTHMSVLRY